MNTELIGFVKARLAMPGPLDDEAMRLMGMLLVEVAEAVTERPSQSPTERMLNAFVDRRIEQIKNS